MKIFLSLLFLSMILYAEIGTIMMIKGAAVITRANSAIEANTGDEIEEGDKIETSAASRVQVMLNDETIITLGANTEYIFDSYDDTNDPHAQMTLNRGFLKTITGKIGKIAPKRFKLKTKLSTIGIRGTTWMVYVGLNVENTVCIHGEIYITTVSKTYDIPEGYMLLITDKIPKKYRTNMEFFKAQIKRIEKKVKARKSLSDENRPPEEEKSEKDTSDDENVDNIPPEMEVDKNLDVEILDITRDVENTIINEVIDKDIENGTPPPPNPPGGGPINPPFPTGASGGT